MSEYQSDVCVLYSAYKAEKRSGRGGRAREGEAGGGGASGAARGVAAAPAAGGAGGAARAHDLAPPLDAHHARRYNDMAPKWVHTYTCEYIHTIIQTLQPIIET